MFCFFIEKFSLPPFAFELKDLRLDSKFIVDHPVLVVSTDRDLKSNTYILNKFVSDQG